MQRATEYRTQDNKTVPYMYVYIHEIRHVNFALIIKTLVRFEMCPTFHIGCLALLERDNNYLIL